jgi:hypothetical protein
MITHMDFDARIATYANVEKRGSFYARWARLDEGGSKILCWANPRNRREPRTGQVSEAFEARQGLSGLSAKARL